MTKDSCASCTRMIIRTMSPKVNQKRKLTDYFSTQSMKKIATTASSDLPQARYPPRTQTLGCSIPPPGTDHVQYITLVPGLELWPNFVTSSEQDSILQFLNDPQQCTWRTDLSRRTMHFGGDYCVMPSRTSKADIASDVPYVATKPEIVTAPPIPSQLLWLLDRMSERKIYKQGDQPQYCIVLVPAPMYMSLHHKTNLAILATSTKTISAYRHTRRTSLLLNQWWACLYCHLSQCDFMNCRVLLMVQCEVERPQEHLGQVNLLM